MIKVDLYGLILMLLGSIIVYGSKKIIKLLKINTDEKKELILKVTGFLIAIVGFLRIFEII